MEYGVGGRMVGQRSVRIEEDDEYVVAVEEQTGIEARGDNVPTALYALSEKLEKEFMQP